MLDGATVIGQDPGTAKPIEAMGAHHTPTGHVGMVVDPNYKQVTAPCYMLNITISQIVDGADAAVEELLGMV